MTMVRRRLGQSDLEITSIGLGTWAIGGRQWGGGQDDRASIEAIHAAVDHGVNWVDTAPIGQRRSRSPKRLPPARRF